ncbi:DUF5110 domain-containing protein [Streptomyces sp. PSKA28]|uniref:DUF5110 domain-containing protein n=1 Tax=Streptomyces himalayensis subsp. himalayensis TaxID=2756131 RepID=A0A7W0DV32_9ACTN|nr:DUF5110 domain-containing protein [Streptomyces himalayensis subsp. himalayensis]
MTSENGTMFRPLAFDFGDAPEVTTVDDQFMLGPALMVCRVTRPQRFGPGAVPVRDAPRSRGVLLPSATDGTDWVDVWDGARHAGGRRIEAPTPLERLPAYARAGSVLPLARPDSGPEDLDILVFPAADGSFELYEDEGDGWGYEQGTSTGTALRWDEESGTLTVGWLETTRGGRPVARCAPAWSSPAEAGPTRRRRGSPPSSRARTCGFACDRRDRGRACPDLGRCPASPPARTVHSGRAERRSNTAEGAEGRNTRSAALFGSHEARALVVEGYRTSTRTGAP